MSEAAVETEVAAAEVERCPVVFGDYRCLRDAGHDGLHAGDEAALEAILSGDAPGMHFE